MTAHRYDFTPDLEAATLSIAREFDAPRDLVWACYTTAELLDRWYAPKPLTARTSHLDFAEGGYWLFAMVMPDGTEFWSRQDYERITPRDRFSAYDAFSDASGAIDPAMPRASMVLTFTPLGDRTLVQTELAYPSTEDLQKVIDMQMEEGLASTLERLDELLVSLKEEV
ncbi:SRPBCC domain-containing protein [Pseudoroseicyclus sp. CXY001]|uniref:SRPBCC family protein n=1 Tax=Pseudoroseicyclus sp. CXY001 TaxID=3242492 RepID=UPI003571307D